MTSRRLVGVVALAVLAVAGCEESKTQLLPLEAAKYKPPKSVAEQTVPPAPEPVAERPIEVAGRLYQPWAAEHQLPERNLRQVGTVEGRPVYALAWDDPPYDRLLIPAPGRPGVWQELVEVHGGPGTVAGEAGRIGGPTPPAAEHGAPRH